MKRIALLSAGFLALGGVACRAPETVTVVPLSIINWYPSGSATCVPRETAMWVTFSAALAPDTLTDDSVSVKTAAGEIVSVVRTYSPDTATIKLQPSTSLSFGSEYVIELGTNIRAASGQQLATPVTSRFRTVPQDGCAQGLACKVDANCPDPVTQACINGACQPK